jgi:hypothetical protein
MGFTTRFSMAVPDFDAGPSDSRGSSRDCRCASALISDGSDERKTKGGMGDLQRLRRISSSIPPIGRLLPLVHPRTYAAPGNFDVRERSTAELEPVEAHSV